MHSIPVREECVRWDSDRIKTVRDSACASHCSLCSFSLPCLHASSQAHVQFQAAHRLTGSPPHDPHPHHVMDSDPQPLTSHPTPPAHACHHQQRLAGLPLAWTRPSPQEAGWAGACQAGADLATPAPTPTPPCHPHPESLFGFAQAQ